MVTLIVHERGKTESITLDLFFDLSVRQQIEAGKPFLLRSVDRSKKIIDAKFEETSIVTNTKKVFFGHGLYKDSTRKHDPISCPFIATIDYFTNKLTMQVRVPIELLAQKKIFCSGVPFATKNLFG